MTMTRGGLEFVGPHCPQDDEILSEDACAFLAGLVDVFAPRRDGLLKARAEWQEKIDAPQTCDTITLTIQEQGILLKIAEQPDRACIAGLERVIRSCRL